MPTTVDEVRRRLREYLEAHTYDEAFREFGIDRAALCRFASGKQKLKLDDRVLEMIYFFDGLRPGNQGAKE